MSQGDESFVLSSDDDDFVPKGPRAQPSAAAVTPPTSPLALTNSPHGSATIAGADQR